MVPAAVIPLVGSAIIWGPAAAYLLLSGHAGAGGGLILWGGVRVSLIDNVLKPLLVKGSRSTPSIIILFSVPRGHHLFRHDRLHPGLPAPLLLPGAFAHLFLPLRR